jgi:hypothetical protein
MVSFGIIDHHVGKPIARDVLRPKSRKVSFSTLLREGQNGKGADGTGQD